MVTTKSLAVALLSLTTRVLGQQTCATINPANPATFASSFSGRVVVNGLSRPRSIVFDNQGNLLTTENAAYGVRYIQLNDFGGTNVCVKSQKQLIADSSINHGIALTPDGKKLFVSSMTTVWSWDYNGSNGTVSNKKTVITGMSDSGHVSRTLLIPKAQPDLLLVQVGSNANLDTEAAQASSGRSQIRIFKLADLEQGSQAYTAGEVLGYGIRNNAGIAETPKGGIFSVNNGMDNMDVNGVDVHLTNPCEELNYHGLITAPTTPERGASYGYPTCHAISDPSVLPAPLNASIRIGDTLTNGNSSARCTRVAPKLCFPAHTAPLDLKFTADGAAAYVSFHGSWNTSPPNGYRVSRVAWDAETGMPAANVSGTAAVTDNIMFNADNANCPGQCFRPVGLAFKEEGRLFVTSDATNEIWVVSGAT
ncbi:soluble quino protein glucose dehydrogenase [Bimuria novae-zelandiae CBS 107.79]|uniref:Soluble quino protein glucose dehydrogenase n=1 Tax=Bimuria novae-zelandiae CBS 107.79 TaxID=1447943 RepID=A0A6A5V5L0_9PLEO|nr:soluble quino protein glucose dehydrogenase [Bimuria novae-zelandiae CBS 107.79]